MNRRNFLKSIGLLGLGTFLLPKEVFSKPNKSELKDTEEIPQDLIKFAKQFSEKYKKLKCGTYISDCGKYRIDYNHQIRDQRTNELVTTPYRVNNNSGIMEFSKSKMVNTPPSFVFNAIIWCSFIIKHKEDYVKADLKALHSLDNGYSKKELFKNYCRIFKNAYTDLNKNRLNEIHKLFK